MYEIGEKASNPRGEGISASTEVELHHEMSNWEWCVIVRSRKYNNSKGSVLYAE